jgi:hypothetical protein
MSRGSGIGGSISSSEASWRNPGTAESGAHEWVQKCHLGGTVVSISNQPGSEDDGGRSANRFFGFAPLLVGFALR